MLVTHETAFQLAVTFNLQLKKLNWRLAVVCLVSASVGLSMAIISIAKLLLLLTAVTALFFNKALRANAREVLETRTVFWIFCALAAFAASMIWTVAPDADALGSFAKYGKLLTIVLLMMLIKDRREALYALCAFVLAQTFLMASSWMLFFNLPVPWATSNMALAEKAVFSSYLDQGIITSVFGVICWHLRDLAPSLRVRWAVVSLGMLSLLNAVFVLGGRSGHAVAIVIVSLAMMWELPKKLRAGILLMPPLLLAALMLTSPKVHDRTMQVVHEVQSYARQTPSATDTSSGIRLTLWHAALTSIGHNPVAGSGIGSWSTVYNQIQHQQNPSHVDIQGNGNPHHEYLLWGVQLGIPGVALLLTLFWAIVRDSQVMDKPASRALQTVVLALAVACLFNSSIYDALIGDFFCVVIGLLMALGLRLKPQR